MSTTGSQDGRVDPIARVATEAGLTDVTGEVLRVLRSLPLAAADDIGHVLNRTVFGVHKVLKELSKLGWVEGTQLGCTRGQRQRWRLTRECLERAGLAGATWHEDEALLRLLERLPSLEQFYAAIGQVKSLGEFTGFQWLDGLDGGEPGCDAAVRYRWGWAALFWCGTLLSETDLVGRLMELPLTFQGLAQEEPQPWPSCLCMVVVDQWEKELVVRALRDTGLNDMAEIRCLADSTVTRPARVGVSKGWVHQAVKMGTATSGRWAGSVAGSPWSGAGGRHSARVLEVVVDWPGSRPGFLKAAVREVPGQSRVRGTCRRLADSGLIRQTGDGQKTRGFATAKASRLRAAQDRISPSDARTRTGLSQWQGASKRRLRRTLSLRHEDGLREFLGPFMERGCPVVAGWRHMESLGDQGGIAPDAMLMLSESPYGAGWHYVEYERTARGEDRVAKKLRGYGSARRRDRYPVVLVCRDDDAEKRFQAQGRESGILLITTTLKRLQEYGALGTTSCWSAYGHRVSIG